LGTSLWHAKKDGEGTLNMLLFVYIYSEWLKQLEIRSIQ